VVTVLALVFPGGASKEELRLLEYLAAVAHAGDDVFIGIASMYMAGDMHVTVVVAAGAGMIDEAS
jgi:hypothetical protein